ncbi:hypothetical protein EV183_002549 [Coemansia sp. RSA 2336]|nr:hypothetical protein EV183_002549 [Coemansia sp. RSA 2336]
MYEDSRKPPRESCASSSSPCSSPITPSMDSLQPDPALADFGKRSATLDGIGAWSSVQPPSTQSVAAISEYSAAPEVGALGKRYGKMSLAQNHATFTDTAGASIDPYPAAAGHTAHATTANAPGTGAAADTHTDTDYSELDEAILRGRSTTLPNIFAVPNPLYRFTAAANVESGTSPGTASPVSTSTFSMLSRHGSISLGNSNRTVSPLGLSLNAIPIHQTNSLDNQLLSSHDSHGQHASSCRLDMLGAGGLMNKPNPAMSGSVSSTSSLAGIGNAPAGSVRRFSEYSAEHASSLALASYSMGPSVFSGSGGASNAHANSAAESINTSGASHDSGGGGPALAPQSSAAAAAIHGIALQPASQISGRISVGGAYQKPSARYGGFGHQLPTMREEDVAGDFAASPSSPRSALMRNASLPNVGSPASMPPRSLGAAGPPSRFSAGRMSSTSPDHDPAGTGPEMAAAAGDWAGETPHMRSLKDMRRPLTDARASSFADLGLREQPGAMAYERAAGLQPPMHQAPGKAGLHRRHSLASPSLPFAGSTFGQPDGNALLDLPGSAMPCAVPGYGGDANMYPPQMHPGALNQQLLPFSMGMYGYGGYSGSIPRQNSTSALQSIFAPQQQQQQQQQQHMSPYQFNPGAIPLSRTPGPNLVMAQYPYQRPAMFGNCMSGQPIYSQQQQQQQQPSALPVPQAHLSGPPQLLQPVPLPPVSTQANQQQQQQQQHLRRASHPNISRIGTPSASLSMAPPVPAISTSTQQSSHSLLPNPATTITPNMPFADMGKGLPFQSLPSNTRVFIVQFKGKRCELYFVPSGDMATKVIPTLAPATGSIPAPVANGTSAKASAPAKANTFSNGKASTEYKSGTYVLVEADRGVDLGMIKEELLSAEAVLSFSSGSSQQSSGSSVASPDDADDASPATENSGSSQPASGKDVYVKRIFRVADKCEVADLQNNKVVDEQNALNMCQSKVQQRKLSMRVVDAEFQFDRRKLTFYFTADRRVDFRELVRDLFKHFKTRIWMCQQQQHQ